MIEHTNASPYAAEVRRVLDATSWHPSTPCEIAARAGLGDRTGQRISGILRRLSRAELVTRWGDGYSLTPAGEAAQRLLRGEDL